MKQKIKKLVLVGLMSSTLLATLPAHAMIVHDPGSLAAAIKQWGVEAYQWAETKVQWAADALARREQTGAIIDANEAVGDKIIKANEQMTQAQADVILAQKLLEETMKAAQQHMPTFRACAEATAKKASIYSRQAGGAGGGRTAAKIFSDIQNTANPGDAMNQTLTVKNKDADLCSEKDKQSARRLPGCSGGSGLKADAQIKAGSIFAAAGTGSTIALDAAGKPKDPSREVASLSMNDKDQYIASIAIKNAVSGIPPSDLPAAAEAAPSGQEYRALKEKYDTRRSFATESLVQIASKSFIPSTVSTALKKVWDSQKALFTELYPTRIFANAGPSVNELLALRVYESDAKVYQRQLSEDPVDGIAGGLAGKSNDQIQTVYMKELISRMNLNNQLQWLNLKQAEQLTAVQANLLAQSLEPVNQAMLSEKFQAATGRKPN